MPHVGIKKDVDFFTSRLTIVQIKAYPRQTYSRINHISQYYDSDRLFCVYCTISIMSSSDVIINNLLSLLVNLSLKRYDSIVR